MDIIEKDKLQAEFDKINAEKNKIELEISEINRKKTNEQNSFFAITKAIGWIGASLAGIAVIVGIFGYLSEIFHNAKLGIEAQLGSTLDYIANGIEFLEFSGGSVIYYGINGNAILPLVVLCVLILINTKRIRESDYYNKLNVVFNLLLVFSQVVTLLCILKTLYGYSAYLMYGIEKNDINYWIVNGRYLELRKFYAGISTPILITAVTLIYWYSMNSSGFFKTSTWIKLTSIFILFTSLVGLPQCYGFLLGKYDYPLIVEYGVKQNRTNPFPRESINIDTSVNAFATEGLLLLKKSDKETIIYNKKKLQIIYISPNTFSWYKIQGEENVLSGRTFLPEKK